MRISDWSSDVCSSDLYTRSIAEIAEAAATCGLEVLAITDTRASPLVAPSRHAFFIPHASSFFSNSMGAYIVFCEGLLNLVARKMGKKALSGLAHREKLRSEEHTSELQSLMRISYAVFCLKKQNYNNIQ